MEEREQDIREVVLSPSAFVLMVLSAIEVYHMETFGLLLGYRGDRFYVELAIPLQSAKRSVYWTKPREEREERIIELSEKLGLGYEILGDYHSHCDIKGSKAIACPSSEDLASMEEGNLYIILAVNRIRRKQRWRILSDGSLSGTVGDYHIKIAAFTPISSWRYRRLRVHCPVATGLEATR